MSDEAETIHHVSPDFMAVEPKEHACDACENIPFEPVVMIEGGHGKVFICSRCLKGGLALLRGLGLTS
jgi:hypothetical protein